MGKPDEARDDQARRFLTTIYGPMPRSSEDPGEEVWMARYGLLVQFLDFLGEGAPRGEAEIRREEAARIREHLNAEIAAWVATSDMEDLARARPERALGARAAIAAVLAAMARVCPEVSGEPEPAPSSDTTFEAAVLDRVVKERERCVAAVDAVAADASYEGMNKVDDLLSNIAEALNLGLSPEATLAYLKRTHGGPGPADSVHLIPGKPQQRASSYRTALAGVVALPALMECSLADFGRRLAVTIREEQEEPLPDNALLAVLCDAARLGDELVSGMERQDWIDGSCGPGLDTLRDALADELEKLVVYVPGQIGDSARVVLRRVGRQP